MTPQVLLGGGLNGDARGRTLEASFHAQALVGLPKVGGLFVPAKAFQAGGDIVDSWLKWAMMPGRLLIVVPPFAASTCDLPVRWEARRTEALAGGETALGRLLARERRHEIRGQLLPLERTAGQVVTAGWRKHPAAGLVVITALPVWSLTALDQRAACAAWLDGLISQAGTAESSPAVAASPEAAVEREPSRDEWVVALHLCTGPYASTQAALDALARSSIHTISAASATIAIEGLAELRLAASGRLNSRGMDALLAGPYAAYARALTRPGGEDE